MTVTSGSGTGRAVLTDEELVAQLLDGSGAAFVAIYRLHARSVAALARSVVGPDAADDVSQDVFVWLLQSASRFDPGRGTLRAFLLMRCHSRAIEFLRSESSRLRRNHRYAVVSSTASTHPPVETEVCDVVLAAEIKQNLALIPPRESAALTMAFFSDLSYRATGDRLGIPEGTAKSRIRAGLGRLQPMLESHRTSI